MWRKYLTYFICNEVIGTVELLVAGVRSSGQRRVKNLLFCVNGMTAADDDVASGFSEEENLVINVKKKERKPAGNEISANSIQISQNQKRHH